MLKYDSALQRANTENLKQIFPENELRGHSLDFHIHESESDLYIPTIDLPILLQEICGPILRIFKSLITINVPLFKKLRDIIFFCGTITL